MDDALIDGRYRVKSTLGAGGMGRVAAAEDLQTGDEVALKILHPELQWNAEATARFLREARTTAQLRSLHTPRTLGFGETADGVPYIAMERLNGEDLLQRLAQGAVETSELVDWTLQALEALAEAHRLGIVHRDLKPENLFLSRSSTADEVCVKVLDFGIAKGLSEASKQGLTASDQMLGTPGYMAPEQMRSAKHVGPAADIWSLGAVLYVALSRSEPFPGKNVTAVVAAVIASDPIPLSQHAPELPSELCDVVMRCLCKAPEQRFEDVGQLARALAPFGGAAAEERVERVDLQLAGASHQTDAVATGPRTAVAVRGIAPGKAWLAAVALAALACGALVWYWKSVREAPAQPLQRAGALSSAVPVLPGATPTPTPRASQRPAPSAQPPAPVSRPLPENSGSARPAKSTEATKARPDLGF